MDLQLIISVISAKKCSEVIVMQTNLGNRYINNSIVKQLQ